MFCPQCGSPNDDAHAFCRQCGASLRRGETPAPAAAPPVSAPPPDPAVTTPPPAAQTAGQATRYANFGWRLLAFILDAIVAGIVGALIGGMLGAMSYLVGVVTGADDNVVSDVIDLLGILAGTVAGWLYEALLVSSSYQATLGKMAVGIVVTDLQGRRISFLRATGRYFGKIVSGMTLMIGYLIQPFTPKRQALHDIMAGCLVLRKVPR